MRTRRLRALPVLLLAVWALFVPAPAGADALAPAGVVAEVPLAQTTDGQTTDSGTSDDNPEDTSQMALVWGGLFALAVVVVAGAIVIIVRRR